MRSHYANITGIAKVLRAQRYSVGKLNYALFHQSIGLKVLRSLTMVRARLYLLNSSIISLISRPRTSRVSNILPKAVNHSFKRRSNYGSDSGVKEYLCVSN
jgi:hypothetical protein